MQKQYFVDDNGLRMPREAVRLLYRTLCKTFHPDMGGTHEGMVELNRQYDEAMDKATRQEMPNRSEASYTHQTETNRKIREAIEAMMRFSFVEIEVTGWWVWVRGTKKRGTSVANDAALDALKAAGYRYASKKEAWYFAGIPVTHNRREHSMDEIRDAYGSDTVKKAQQEAQSDRQRSATGSATLP